MTEFANFCPVRVLHGHKPMTYPEAYEGRIMFFKTRDDKGDEDFAVDVQICALCGCLYATSPKVVEASPKLRSNGRLAGDLEGMCIHENYDTEDCPECDALIAARPKS